MEALSREAKRLLHYGKYDQGVEWLKVKEVFSILKKTSIEWLPKCSLKNTTLVPWKLAKLKTIWPRKGRYAKWINEL